MRGDGGSGVLSSWDHGTNRGVLDHHGHRVEVSWVAMPGSDPLFVRCRTTDALSDHRMSTASLSRKSGIYLNLGRGKRICQNTVVAECLEVASVLFGVVSV